MSNVISFLELLGRDSSLRYGDDRAVAQALANSAVDAALWPAVMSGDVRRLEEEVGAAPNVCAVIFPVDDCTDRTDR